MTPPHARCSGQGIWQIPTPSSSSAVTSSETAPARNAAPEVARVLVEQAVGDEHHTPTALVAQASLQLVERAGHATVTEAPPQSLVLEAAGHAGTLPPRADRGIVGIGHRRPGELP